MQLGASYAVSRRASERMQEAQRRVAQLVNAERPEEAVMGPTSTRLVQLLARAMAHQFAPGDELVVSRADHESNIGAWVGLESIGVVPRFWELNRDTGALELDDLDRVMSPRTKLVAFTHASNIFGTIHPVAEIARFVHDRGAKVCVDGVAYGDRIPYKLQPGNPNYELSYGAIGIVSMVHYNTVEEIDRLIQGLDTVV